MATRPANHGTKWPGEDSEKLTAFAAENLPLRFIASKLGRTERTIQEKPPNLA
jgi:hypothetical protein